LVDTEGLLLKTRVFAANVQDYNGAKLLLKGGKYLWPRIKLVWADGGYQAREFREWLADEDQDEDQSECGWFLQLVSKPDGMGFVPLPHRWVVERSFAWYGRYRRLSKDYEFLPQSSEAMIYLASIRTMLHRLVRKSKLPRTSRLVPLALLPPSVFRHPLRITVQANSSIIGSYHTTDASMAKPALN
jgi:putative transposase